MCVRTVFYNTYNDGHEDVTERVESCTPGYICPNPVLIQYDRTYNCSRLQAKTSQVQPDRSWKVSSSLSRRRSDRRSKAPAPFVPEPPTVRPIPIKRASTMAYASTERVPERGRRPIIIEDRVPHAVPGGVANTASPVPVEVLTHSSSPRHRSSHRHQHYYHPSTHAATTAATAAASTTATVGASTRSDFLSPHTVTINNTTTGSRSNSRHQHHHRHSWDDHTPRGYGSAEDDQERSDRRRRRHDERVRASVEPSSVPALGSTDMSDSSSTKAYNMFDSSHGGGGYGGYTSYGSSPSSPASPASVASPSAPSSPASVSKKELRWEDKERRWQNVRISMRPKPYLRLHTATTAALPPQQGEVKSILKNGSQVPVAPIEERSPRTAARASPRDSPQTAASPVSNPADHSDLDDVFGAFLGLGIHSRRSSAEQQRQQSSHPEIVEEQRRQDRLRDRFSMPPPPPLARRYTAGGSFKKRISYWYP